MGEKIIVFPGNKERLIMTRKNRKKGQKQKAKYQGAVTYPIHDDGEKGIKSGKSYSTCRLI